MINMISTEELKKILQVKKMELNQEKQQMGFTVKQDYRMNAENETNQTNKLDSNEVSGPQVPTTYQKTEIREDNGIGSGLENQELRRTSPTPPEVAKYMRRHTGLPTAMLKTGEYSPNHPLLLRQTDTSGNVFLGFGEYEEQKKKLRKLRQQEYRDYLDKQTEQKQKKNILSQAEARKSDIAAQNYRPLRYSDSTVEVQNSHLRRQQPQNGRDERNINQNICSMQNTSQPRYVSDSFGRSSFGDQNSNRTVDSTTQCDGYFGQRKPSVAVQTDESELDKLSENFKLRRSSETNMQAERELSPRTVLENNTVSVSHSQIGNNYGWKPRNDGLSNKQHYFDSNDARCDLRVKDSEYLSSHGFGRDETHQSSPRRKLLQDLRHSYMPSILDADVIQRRNLKAEEEAAAKRESYQEELKNQIVEQQRIKEERKVREKLLEQAEMRRLEQQLRTLQLAQDGERDKQNKITSDIRENNKQYLRESKHLQDEIVAESKKLLRAKSHGNTRTQTGNLTARTWKSDYDKPKPSNLPLYYAYQPTNKANEQKIPKNESFTKKLPNPKNIPDKLLFSPKHKSSYLSMNSVPYRFDSKNGTEKVVRENELDRDNCNEIDINTDKNKNRYSYINDDENLVQYGRDDNRLSVSDYKPSFLNKDISELIVRRKSDFDVDSLPIPVLRHSVNNLNENLHETDSKIVVDEKVIDRNSSDAMQKVERKWEIPIVQRNIVRSVPDVQGRSGNGNILTQLGSIRRQLQMEQLKLDKMLAKGETD